MRALQKAEFLLCTYVTLGSWICTVGKQSQKHLKKTHFRTIFPLGLKKFPEFCEQNILRTCAPSWAVRKSLHSLTNSLSVYTDKLKQVREGIPSL